MGLYYYYIIALGLWVGSPLFGYTANKLWFEFREDGRYRVYVNYTVPALKEFRESWVDFKSKKAAEAFYWDLARGADFFPEDPQKRRFVAPKLRPEPW